MLPFEKKLIQFDSSSFVYFRIAGKNKNNVAQNSFQSDLYFNVQIVPKISAAEVLPSHMFSNRSKPAHSKQKMCELVTSSKV